MNQDTAKQWFRTQLKPTQGQFWQTFAWLRWKDEPIEIADIDGLDDAIATKANTAVITELSELVNPIIVELVADGSYLLPEGGLITHMVFIPSFDSVIKVGSAAGTNDLLADTPCPADQETAVGLLIPGIRANRTIYFSGVAGAIQILIYKR